MTHWALDYIGKPWGRAASGPQAFDCWGLVVRVQESRFGTSMPAIAEQPGTLRELADAIQQHQGGWLAVTRPRDGDIVLMARRKIPVHIGVWITANGHGGVLHSSELAGVTFNRLDALRVQGWGSITFWRKNPDE